MKEGPDYSMDAIDYLMSDGSYWLEEHLKVVGVEYEVAMGVARQVKGRGVKSLSPAQVRVFDRAWRPLIEGVPCEGPVGMVVNDEESSCVHGGYIDEQSLVLAYELEDFVCQNCRYDREKME